MKNDDSRKRGANVRGSLAAEQNSTLSNAQDVMLHRHKNW